MKIKEFRVKKKNKNRNYNFIFLIFFKIYYISTLIPKKYKAIQAKQVAKAMIACMKIDQTGLQIIESYKIAAL